MYNYGVKTIKRQTRAAYGRLVVGQSPWALVAPCTCYMPLPLQESQRDVRMRNRRFIPIKGSWTNLMSTSCYWHTQ